MLWSRKWNMLNASTLLWPMTAVLFLPVKIIASTSTVTWWPRRWWDRTMEGQELVHHQPRHSPPRPPLRIVARWLLVSARHHHWSMVTMAVPWRFQHQWQVMVIRKKERKKERKSVRLSVCVYSSCSFPSGSLVSICHHYHCLLCSSFVLTYLLARVLRVVALFFSMILVRPDRQAREKEWIPRSRKNSDHRPEEQIFSIEFHLLFVVC